MGAFDLATGQQAWTATDGAMSPPVVAGNSVYAVTDRNEIARFDRQTGALVWSTPLPLFVRDNPRRRSRAHAHWGPVLAGGRLVVVSSDDRIRSFDPATGRLVASLPLDGGAAAAPAVAGQTMYVVTADGRLRAFR